MGTRVIQQSGAAPAASGNQSWPGLGQRYPNQAAILAQLAPLHWWSANNVVQSGGLVDSITDIGTLRKDFTQVGAARAPLATDANGQAYIALDGVADYYQAGAAADWTLFNNGTSYTLAINGTMPSLATGFEQILGTSANDSTRRGFDFAWYFTSASEQGPYFSIYTGVLNTQVVFLESNWLAAGVQFALIIRVGGANALPRAVNGCQNYPIVADMAMNGLPRATNYRNTNFSGTAPSFALTLGRRADLGAGQFSKLRVYDVLLHSDPWSNDECALWLQYARTRRGLQPQYGWPSSGALQP